MEIVTKEVDGIPKTPELENCNNTVSVEVAAKMQTTENVPLKAEKTSPPSLNSIVTKQLIKAKDDIKINEDKNRRSPQKSVINNNSPISYTKEDEENENLRDRSPIRCPQYRDLIINEQIQSIQTQEERDFLFRKERSLRYEQLKDDQLRGNVETTTPIASVNAANQSLTVELVDPLPNLVNYCAQPPITDDSSNEIIMEEVVAPKSHKLEDVTKAPVEVAARMQSEWNVPLKVEITSPLTLPISMAKNLYYGTPPGILIYKSDIQEKDDIKIGEDYNEQSPQMRAINNNVPITYAKEDEEKENLKDKSPIHCPFQETDDLKLGIQRSPGCEGLKDNHLRISVDTSMPIDTVKAVNESLTVNLVEPLPDIIDDYNPEPPLADENVIKDVDGTPKSPECENLAKDVPVEVSATMQPTENEESPAPPSSPRMTSPQIDGEQYQNTPTSSEYNSDINEEIDEIDTNEASNSSSPRKRVMNFYLPIEEEQEEETLRDTTPMSSPSQESDSELLLDNQLCGSNENINAINQNPPVAQVVPLPKRVNYYGQVDTDESSNEGALQIVISEEDVEEEM